MAKKVNSEDETIPKEIRFAKFNAKDSLILRHRYSIDKFPQLVFFKNNKPKKYNKNSLRSRDIISWLHATMTVKKQKSISFPRDKNNIILLNEKNTEDVAERYENLFIHFCELSF